MMLSVCAADLRGPPESLAVYTSLLQTFAYLTNSKTGPTMHSRRWPVIVLGIVAVVATVVVLVVVVVGFIT